MARPSEVITKRCWLPFASSPGRFPAMRPIAAAIGRHSQSASCPLFPSSPIGRVYAGPDGVINGDSYAPPALLIRLEDTLQRFGSGFYPLATVTQSVVVLEALHGLPASERTPQNAAANTAIAEARGRETKGKLPLILYTAAIALAFIVGAGCDLRPGRADPAYFRPPHRGRAIGKP